MLPFGLEPNPSWSIVNRIVDVSIQIRARRLFMQGVWAVGGYLIRRSFDFTESVTKLPDEALQKFKDLVKLHRRRL